MTAPPATIIPVAEPKAASKTPKIAVALYDYAAVGEGELSIKENENLLVLDDTDEDWWTVRSMKKGGGEGYVPKTYVQVLLLWHVINVCDR